MVICLKQGANDMHMVQLMPLLPHLLLHWIGFTFTYLGSSPRQNPESRKAVVVVVVVTFLVPAYTGCLGEKMDVVVDVLFKHSPFKSIINFVKV